MDRGRPAPAPEGEDPEGAEAERPRFRRSWFWAWCALGIAVVVTALGMFVVQPFGVPSGSMEPLLKPGDRLLVNRLAYLSHPPRRGDVVVFDGDGAFGGGGDYVKRVIGVGGDHVRCCGRGGRVTVNGRPLDEHRYLHRGDAPSEDRFDVTVPHGRLFVLGDHRSASADSRAHLGDPGGGMVPTGEVVGRAQWLVWPVARWGGLS